MLGCTQGMTPTTDLDIMVSFQAAIGPGASRFRSLRAALIV